MRCPSCKSKNIYKFNYYIRDRQSCVCLTCGVKFLEEKNENTERILYSEMVTD